jgi:6-phosphofructokinase 2
MVIILYFWQIETIESKVGAVDSTVAGIVLSLSQGNSLLNYIKFGLTSEAAAVTTPGSELCRREDARQLFRSIADTKTFFCASAIN